MPISTSAEVWNKAKDGQTLQEEILEYLKENPQEAYRARELADETVSTEWAAAEELARIRQDVGEEEFRENREEYEAEVGEDRGAGGAVLDQIQTSRVQSQAEELVKEGQAEKKRIDVDHTDIPHDWETASYFTYTGEEE